MMMGRADKMDIGILRIFRFGLEAHKNEHPTLHSCFSCKKKKKKRNKLLFFLLLWFLFRMDGSYKSGLRSSTDQNPQIKWRKKTPIFSGTPLPVVLLLRIPLFSWGTQTERGGNKQADELFISVTDDHSRITLKAENNHGNSDYINASPIVSIVCAL